MSDRPHRLVPALILAIALVPVLLASCRSGNARAAKMSATIPPVTVAASTTSTVPDPCITNPQSCEEVPVTEVPSTTTATRPACVQNVATVSDPATIIGVFQSAASQTIGRVLTGDEQRLVVTRVQQAERQSAHGTYDPTYGDCVYQAPPTLNESYASYVLTQMFPTEAVGTRMGSYANGVMNMLRGCDYSGANCNAVQPGFQSSP